MTAVVQHPPAGRAPIRQRVSALENKPRLDLDAAARAIAGMRRPDVVRDRLGDALRYSQRVEANVADLGIDILLPHDPDSDLGRFLRVWVPDETGHAVSQSLLLAALDLPAETTRAPGHVPPHNRAAGWLGRLSDRAHEIVSMTYHSIGAMNERLAMGAYHQMGVIAGEMGETTLVDGLLRPTYRDEAFHLGYYRTTALQLRAQLSKWQLAASRALIVHTYFPVGAGGKEDRAPFGEVVLALEDDPDNPTIADAIYEIATDLIGRPGEPLPQFTRRALQSCVDLAREARTAQS